MDKIKVAKGIAIGAGALVFALGGAGIGAASVDPVTKVINETVNVCEPITTIEYVDQEVLVEVLVDNENLALVLEHLYDNDGEVEYLLDDLDDDEIDQIVDRIMFVNEVKVLAPQWVEEHAFDELHKEMVGDVRLDDDDMERLRVYDDADEIVVEDADFEDYDADAIVKVRFEQDDVKYAAWFAVEFKDGVLDDGELLDVELRE